MSQTDLFDTLTDEPDTEPDMVEADACECVICGEEGAESEFFVHDASGGPLCPECIKTANPTCVDCDSRFDKRGARRFIRSNGTACCYYCNERKKSCQPQPELAKHEATAEAMIALEKMQWVDDTHRNRVLFHLRENLESRRNREKKQKKKSKIFIEEAYIKPMWRRTRLRDIKQIAEEYWTIIDQYDRDSRSGTPIADEVYDHLSELQNEANDGTSMGCAVNKAPLRMLSLVKWRARREGRLPMWGIEQKFRFKWRGINLIAETKYGMGIYIDEDREKAGTPCHSETGYRSFTGTPIAHEDGQTLEEYAIEMLEAYYHAPTKDGCGMGEKMRRWTPMETRAWARLQREKADGRTYDPEYRKTSPSMTDEADRAQYWKDRDADMEADAAKALAWMDERDIDPFVLFPQYEAARQEALL